MKAWLRLGLVLGLAAQLASCEVNEYCVNCVKPTDAATPSDGASGDGGPLPMIDAPSGSDGNPCQFTGNEVCDGKDNDCNGQVDDGVVPGVGEACGTDTGECTVGVKQCVMGALKCNGVNPTPEICDGKDNDCNGVVDNGDPGGGGTCGTNIGECVAGVNRCQGGAITCVGAIGAPDAVAEVCDGRDNDCDGMVDDGIATMGSCGLTDVGECKLGTLTCMGGQAVCVGEVGPAYELCDALDQDCDGNATNGFDLMGDARNCGQCGRVCSAAHAVSACIGGACGIGSCVSGYYNVDNLPSNGCEYGPCTYNGPSEVCNGMDDNCNGSADEALTPPAICSQVGACAGAMASCQGAQGWRCTYGADVSVDAAGQIIPETACDNIDNDCDGEVDEGDPDKGAACDDGGQGQCRGTGVKVCAADPMAATVCQIVVPGQAAASEVCDGVDNDCNGMIDDGGATGNLPGQEWVALGGVQIMKFEASRPDATPTEIGNAGHTTCSRAGVQPWVNVTAPQAQAACEAVGARLCTEQEWHRACAAVPATTYPVAGPAGTNLSDRVFIEAENFFASVRATFNGTTRAWVPDNSTGYSGISAMRASPNTGSNVPAANAPAESPRLDYAVNFLSSGQYRIFVRILGATNSDDAVWVGVNSSAPGVASGTQLASSAGAWTWVRSAQIGVTAPGVHTVSIYMRDDGVRVDALVIAKDTQSTVPSTTSSAGGTWAYATSPNTASNTTCNADPYDTNSGLAGDQDDILPAGALAQCYAAGPAGNHAFDMSGNVREWTAPRLQGANPIRGGASNAPVNGTTCALGFTLADDSFFFPNVGFRCCR